MEAREMKLFLNAFKSAKISLINMGNTLQNQPLRLKKEKKKKTQQQNIHTTHIKNTTKTNINKTKNHPTIKVIKF